MKKPGFLQGRLAARFLGDGAFYCRMLAILLPMLTAALLCGLLEQNGVTFINELLSGGHLEAGAYDTYARAFSYCTAVLKALTAGVMIYSIQFAAAGDQVRFGQSIAMKMLCGLPALIVLILIHLNADTPWMLMLLDLLSLVVLIFFTAFAATLVSTGRTLLVSLCAVAGKALYGVVGRMLYPNFDALLALYLERVLIVFVQTLLLLLCIYMQPKRYAQILQPLVTWPSWQMMKRMGLAALCTWGAWTLWEMAGVLMGRYPNDAPGLFMEHLGGDFRPVMATLITCIGGGYTLPLLIAVTSAVLVGQHLGRKDQARAEETASHMSFVGLICGLQTAAFMLYWIPQAVQSDAWVLQVLAPCLALLQFVGCIACVMLGCLSAGGNVWAWIAGGVFSVALALVLVMFPGLPYYLIANAGSIPTFLLCLFLRNRKGGLRTLVDVEPAPSKQNKK